MLFEIHCFERYFLNKNVRHVLEQFHLKRCSAIYVLHVHSTMSINHSSMRDEHQRTDASNSVVAMSRDTDATNAFHTFWPGCPHLSGAGHPICLRWGERNGPLRAHQMDSRRPQNTSHPLRSQFDAAINWFARAPALVRNAERARENSHYRDFVSAKQRRVVTSKTLIRRRTQRGAAKRAEACDAQKGSDTVIPCRWAARNRTKQNKKPAVCFKVGFVLTQKFASDIPMWQYIFLKLCKIVTQN